MFVVWIVDCDNVVFLVMGVVSLFVVLFYGGYIVLLIVVVVGWFDGLCFVVGGLGD